MKIVLPVSVLLLALGGCSSLYQSPYREQLKTGWPAPPPISTQAADRSALLPYLTMETVAGGR